MSNTSAHEPSIKYLTQPIPHLKYRESKASLMVMGYFIENLFNDLCNDKTLEASCFANFFALFAKQTPSNGLDHISTRAFFSVGRRVCPLMQPEFPKKVRCVR